MFGFLRQRSLGKKSKAPNTIEELVRREFGLRVRKRSFYTEALRHSSMLDGDTTGSQSNERLEFLGDAVLDLAVAAHLFTSFPREQEGPLTQRKSRIVNRKTLNLLGDRMGIQHLIEVRMRRRDIHDSMLGNALEALIGALYLDHGYRKANLAVLRMIRRFGVDEIVHETVDFKSKLYHWTQKRRSELEFVITQERANGSETEYEMEARVDGKSLGTGTGGSKKTAEQAAARAAWKSVFEDEADDRGNSDTTRGTRSPDSGSTSNTSRSSSKTGSRSSSGSSRASGSRRAASDDASPSKSRAPASRRSARDTTSEGKPRRSPRTNRSADETKRGIGEDSKPSRTRGASRSSAGQVKTEAKPDTAPKPSEAPSATRTAKAGEGRPRGTTGRRRAKPEE